MRDSISLQRANELHPFIRDEVINTITDIENNKFSPYMAIRIVQGGRTFEYQDGLYKLGRTVKNPDGYNAKKKPLGNIVTNSKGGQSIHCYWLAVDFAILYDKDQNGTFEKLSWDLVADIDRDGEADWMEVVDAFEDLGYNWGGRWHTIVDNPHLDKSKGLNWKQLLAKYNANDFIPRTHFVNL